MRITYVRISSSAGKGKVNKCRGQHMNPSLSTLAELLNMHKMTVAWRQSLRAFRRRLLRRVSDEPNDLQSTDVPMWTYEGEMLWVLFS